MHYFSCFRNIELFNSHNNPRNKFCYHLHIWEEETEAQKFAQGHTAVWLWSTCPQLLHSAQMSVWRPCGGGNLGKKSNTTRRLREPLAWTWRCRCAGVYAFVWLVPPEFIVSSLKVGILKSLTASKSSTSPTTQAPDSTVEGQDPRVCSANNLLCWWVAGYVMFLPL